MAIWRRSRWGLKLSGDPTASLNTFDDSGRYYKRSSFLLASDLVIPDAPPDIQVDSPSEYAPDSTPE